MRMIAACLMTVAFAASAAAQQSPLYMITGSSPNGVGVVRLDKINDLGGGKKTADIAIIMPPGMVLDGKQAEFAMATVQYDCASGTSQRLSGTMFEHGPKVLGPIRPQPTPFSHPVNSAEWLNMKAVCAASAEERAQFGKLQPDAVFDTIVARVRADFPKS